MRNTISVRLDEEAMRALQQLETSLGVTRSEAIRRAILQDATLRQVLAAEAKAIGEDEQDRKEIAEVRALMDELSEPW